MNANCTMEAPGVRRFGLCFYRGLMLNILRVSCVSLATLLESIIIVSCDFNLDAIVRVGTEEMAPHVMVIFSR